jgi:hypothetical protein
MAWQLIIKMPFYNFQAFLITGPFFSWFNKETFYSIANDLILFTLLQILNILIPYNLAANRHLVASRYFITFRTQVIYIFFQFLYIVLKNHSEFQ